MSVQFRDFKNIAIPLADADTEIEWRISASRTYYAAFHLAQASVDLCPDNGNLKMGSHERLTDRFMQHGKPSAKSICYMLQSMKKVRVIADYEIADEFQQDQAKEQISYLNQLEDKLCSFENQFRQSA